MESGEEEGRGEKKRRGMERELVGMQLTLSPAFPFLVSIRRRLWYGCHLGSGRNLLQHDHRLFHLLFLRLHVLSTPLVGVQQSVERTKLPRSASVGELLWILPKL